MTVPKVMMGMDGVVVCLWLIILRVGLKVTMRIAGLGFLTFQIILLLLP